jgi:hypothetical protein
VPVTVRKGLALALAATLAVAVILVSVAVVVTSTLGDVPWLRERVVSVLSRQLHGTVTMRELRLSLLPLPHVVLDQVRLSIPGSVEASVASVSVYPELLPLLRGRLQITTVHVDEPDATLQFPHRKEADAAGPASLAELRDRAAAALAAAAAVAAAQAPGVTVVAQGGRIRLATAGTPPWSFTDLRARLRFSPQQLEVDLSGASNLWEGMVVNAAVDPVTFTGSGRIEITRLRPELLTAPLFPNASLQLGDSELNLGMRLTAEAPTVLKADVDVSFPHLTLHRGSESVVAQAGRVQGTLRADEHAAEFVLHALEVDTPRLRLSGSLSVDPTAMLARIDANATDLDVASLRETARVVAGELPAVRQIFTILQAGHVSQLTVHSEAHTLAGLGDWDALVIRGTLANARVHVPGVDLDLDEVGGEASITGGVLAGERLAARLGNSRARDGALRLGLRGTARELHVDTTVEADAAQLPALLKRLVGGALARELERVSDVRGTALGKLVLSGTTRDVLVTADVSSLKLSVRTPILKDPVYIDGGRISYAPKRIAATDLMVTAGGSALSQLSFNVDWADTPASVSASATNSRIVLGEVYPRLVASGRLGNAGWIPRAMTGTLVVSSAQLSGPATVPAKWQFKLAGAARDLDIDSPLLRKRAALRDPVSISDALVARNARGSIAFSGTLAAAGGLTAAVDLVRDPEVLHVNRLSVRDAASDATVSFLLEPPEIDLSFDGKLSRSTLAAVLPEYDVPGARVRGNFRTRIRIDQPGNSTAEGRLEASDVFLPAPGNGKLLAETLSLEARGGTLFMQAALVNEAKNPFQVMGTVSRSPHAFVADLDVSAGHLDWAAIEPLLPRKHDSGGSVPPESALTVPLRGVLRVTADSFTYGRFTWKPLQATVALAAAGPTVTVTEANLCGIATPGRITVAPGGLDLNFRPSAKQAQLDQTMTCMGAENGVISGEYTLTGSAIAQGRPAEIAKAMRGQLTFESTRGRIYRQQTVATLLSVLSIATGSVYGVPDVAREGLAYDRIAVTGDLEGGILRLKEAVLTGPSAAMVGEGSVDVIGRTIDLTLLVAPLKTIDSVVSRIPILRDFLNNTLVSIPVQISGATNAPQVRPISLSAVGQRLLGSMERTVKLPVKLFARLLPKRK